MYSIEKVDFGFKITFDGFIRAEEMKQWRDESEEVLRNSPDQFGVFADMRKMKTLPQESQGSMHEGQKLYVAAGLVRSVVIVENAIVHIQFKRIAKETGVYKWERYIDASADENWESKGILWITKGIDPDK